MLTLSMRVFDPRDSAYAVNLTYDRHTYNWRARETSETHSGLFNRESRIYIIVIGSEKRGTSSKKIDLEKKPI